MTNQGSTPMSVRSLWEPPHENIANALTVFSMCGTSYDVDSGSDLRTMSQIDFAMISARLTRTHAQLDSARARFPNLYAMLFNPKLTEGDTAR